MFDGGTDGRREEIAGLDEVRLRRRGFGLDSHAPASQKIDALVVCDAEDPGSEGTTPSVMEPVIRAQ